MPITATLQNVDKAGNPGQFTATLQTIDKAGDPGQFDVGALYADSASGWTMPRQLRVSIDPTMPAPQQQAQLQAAVRADAKLYKDQLATEAAIASLIGQTITI